MQTPAHDHQAFSDLLDKEAIRDVICRYCRAADRCDLALLKSCYHDDATDDHGFFAGNAHAFAEYVVTRLKQIDLSIHSITNILIELDGERAMVESQWSVIHRVRRWFLLTDLLHQGRYLDLFEKRNGEWKILKRISVSDADRWLAGVDIWSLTPKNAPQQLIRGARFPSDPIYERKNMFSAKGREHPPVDELWKPMKILISIPKWLVSFISWVKQ